MEIVAACFVEQNTRILFCMVKIKGFSPHRGPQPARTHELPKKKLLQKTSALKEESQNKIEIKKNYRRGFFCLFSMYS